MFLKNHHLLVLSFRTSQDAPTSSLTPTSPCRSVSYVGLHDHSLLKKPPLTPRPNQLQSPPSLSLEDAILFQLFFNERITMWYLSQYIQVLRCTENGKYWWLQFNKSVMIEKFLFRPNLFITVIVFLPCVVACICCTCLLGLRVMVKQRVLIACSMICCIAFLICTMSWWLLLLIICSIIFSNGSLDWYSRSRAYP